MTAEGSLSEDKKFSAKIKGAGPKIDAFSLEKVEIASKGTVKAEAKFVGVVEGLDATFALEDGTRTAKKDVSAKVGATYTSSSVTGEVKVDVADGPIVEASLLFDVQRVLVGTKIVADTAGIKKADKPDRAAGVTDYDVIVGYRKEGTLIAAQTSDRLQNVKVGVSHRFKDGELAAAVTGATRIVKGDKAAEKVTVDVGTSWASDASTTIFAAVNNEGIARVAAATAVTPKTKITLCAQIDLQNIGRDVHKFGTKINVSL